MLKLERNIMLELCWICDKIVLKITSSYEDLARLSEIESEIWELWIYLIVN